MTSLWPWILTACLVTYLTKLAGYLVPPRWLSSEAMTRVAATLTIGLLASLTALNAVSAGRSLALDARAGSLVAAAIALWLRVPFLAVVVIGAAVASLFRLAGIG